MKTIGEDIDLHVKPFDESSEDFMVFVLRLERNIAVTSTKAENRVAKMIKLLSPKIKNFLKNLITPEKPKDIIFEQLVQILQERLCPRRLTIVERFRFHKRNQFDGESIRAFSDSLNILSTHCDFGENLMGSLRDQFVFGLRNQFIQQQLLWGEELTYESAVKNATDMETVVRNSLESQNKSASVSVNKLSTARNVPKNRTTGNKSKESGPRNKQTRSPEASYSAFPSTSGFEIGEPSTSGQAGYRDRSSGDGQLTVVEKYLNTIRGGLKKKELKSFLEHSKNKSKLDSLLQAFEISAENLLKQLNYICILYYKNPDRGTKFDKSFMIKLKALKVKLERITREKSKVYMMF